MKFNASISPNSLVTQMTAFAYERNQAFQTGEIDVASFRTAEETRVGISVDDIRPLYDNRSVTFRAERPTHPTSRNLILPPDLFSINYTEKKHLSAVPPMLASYLPPETIASYHDCFYGELHEIRGVKYTVQKDATDVDINRDISYHLFGATGALYEISELDESADKVQWIPLAHEQRSLRVEQRIQEEQVEDQIDQLTFNAQFADFRHDSENTEFYTDLRALRIKEATLCISALVHCMKRGSRIPAYDQLIDIL